MVSINTSDYIKYKPVEIDGVNLGIRTMNSAEALEITALQREMKEKDADNSSILQRLIDIFFGIYDDETKARELLSKLSIDALSDIYTKVMGEK